MSHLSEDQHLIPGPLEAMVLHLQFQSILTLEICA